MAALFVLLLALVAQLRSCSSSTAADAPVAEFYVDPVNGNDDNPGTSDAAFRSVYAGAAAAFTAAASAHHQLNVTVWLRAGHHVGATQHGRVIGLENAGADWPAGTRVVFQAYPGERAVLSGGLHVNQSQISIGGTTAGGKAILEIDLQSLPDATDPDYSPKGGKMFNRKYGSLQPHSMSQCTADKIEVFVNGQPLHLARYPNSARPDARDTWQWLHVTAGSTNSSFILPLARDRAKRWEAEKDLWFHAYPKWDWSDSFVRASRTHYWGGQLNVTIDPRTPPRVVTLPPLSHTPPQPVS